METAGPILLRSFGTGGITGGVFCFLIYPLTHLLLFALFVLLVLFVLLFILFFLFIQHSAFKIQHFF
jgi:hypothetical protein